MVRPRAHRPRRARNPRRGRADESDRGGARHGRAALRLVGPHDAAFASGLRFSRRGRRPAVARCCGPDQPVCEHDGACAGPRVLRHHCRRRRPHGELRRASVHRHRSGTTDLPAPQGIGGKARVTAAELAGLGNLPDKLGAMATAYARYWLALPKANGVPRKRDLDLGGMRIFLANFVMVERHDRAKFTWRLAGSAIRELSGVELTGTDALAARDPAQRAKGVAPYNAQLDTPCGSWGIVILQSAAGNRVPTEVMVFPLRADDGALCFLANTVDPAASAWQPGQRKATDMKLLSWPEHRFVDIGFGLPKLARRSR